MITLSANKRYGRCAKGANLLIYTSNKELQFNATYIIQNEKVLISALSVARIAINRYVSSSNPEIGAVQIVLKRLLQHEQPDSVVAVGRCTFIDMHTAMSTIRNSYLLTDKEKENVNKFWLEIISSFKLNAAGEISRKSYTKQVKPVEEKANDDVLTAKVIAVIKAMKEQGVL